MTVRNPRAEAAEMLGEAGVEVRVLEPSPPAVDEAPWFADDPVAGGDVVPVERPGSQSWAEVSAGNAALTAWCEDRWLVRRTPLVAPLPPDFVATRKALHTVAVDEISPQRQAANGKIGLRFTHHGFGTPFFGADRQVRVEDGELVDGTVRHPISGVDIAAARVLGDWYGMCCSLLEQLRAEDTNAADHAPSRVQIWPEHFDIAVDLGPEGARANYGGSPGDDQHSEPYLYVGPWDAGRTGDFWNEPFGASLSYADILSGADPLTFLRQGRDLLAADPRSPG